MRKIKAEDVVGDLYDENKVMTWPIEAVVELIKVNFQSALEGLDMVLEPYMKTIKEKDNNKKMMDALSEAVATINKWKGKYSYE